MADEPSTRQFRLAAILPRFSLRALFVAVLIVAVIVELTKVYWPTIVGLLEARQYAVLQAGEAKFVAKQREETAKSGSWSTSVDEGRPVPDDFVILVRRGDQFGCLIPRHQNMKGESLEYDWYFRSDGGGRFKPGDPQVQSGHTFAGPYVSGGGLVRVKFGPFDFEWSGHGKGWGFLYYGEGPIHSATSVPADHPRVCATNLKTVEYIDARDGKWLYKAYVGDAGIAGNIDSREPVPKESGAPLPDPTQVFNSAPR